MRRSGQEAIRAALHAELKHDRSVFLLGPGVGLQGGRAQTTAGLIHEFGPGRVLDLPLAPAALLGAALGAAYTGLRPVLEWPELEGSANSILARVAGASHRQWSAPAPLVVRARAGAAGGWDAMPAGWKVVLAADPASAQGLLVGAIRDPNPVLFLESPAVDAATGETPEAPTPLELGRARVARTGRDLTVFCCGGGVGAALQLAEALAREAIEIEVVDLRSLQPLDEATAGASLRKTSKGLVLHDGVSPAGWPDALSGRLQEIAFPDLDAPLLRVAMESGDPANSPVAAAARRLASY